MLTTIKTKFRMFCKTSWGDSVQFPEQKVFLEFFVLKLFSSLEESIKLFTTISTTSTTNNTF